MEGCHAMSFNPILTLIGPRVQQKLVKTLIELISVLKPLNWNYLMVRQQNDL